MTESSAMTIETMLASRRNNKNIFASSSVHAKVENYMTLNTNRIESESTSTGTKVRRMEEGDDNGGDNKSYTPSFEGYLNIDFSIHVPCDHSAMLDCRLTIDDSSQSRLESLVMLFLCSQGVELVISTAPDTLLHVCPFNNNGNDRSNQNAPTGQAMTKASSNALLGDTQEESDQIILWNLPRFVEETVAFDDPSFEKKTVLDMATNTTFIFSNGPAQQYYTKLRFTYPVYQWGAEDPSIANALQEDFDASVVSTGTLDSLLPWPGSIAAPTGNEPYIFWDEPLPEPIGVYDTTIPVGVGRLLQHIGGVLMVANTLVIIVLTILGRSSRTKRNSRNGGTTNKSKDEGERSNQHWRNTGHRHESDYLDTEAGVSAILMESKHYALAKSEAFVASQIIGTKHNSSSKRSTLRSNNLTHKHGDRNITGVEVDLKMIDHSSQLRRQVTLPVASSSSSSTTSSSAASRKNNQNNTHYDHSRAPPTSAEKKEDLLLARAKTVPSGTPWFSDKKLLPNGNSGYDDEEAAAENDDLKILDMASPQTSSNKNNTKTAARVLGHRSVRLNSSGEDVSC